MNIGKLITASALGTGIIFTASTSASTDGTKQSAASLRPAQTGRI